MKYLSELFGFDQTGVVFSRKDHILLRTIRYPASHYRTRHGYAVPLTNKSHLLLKYLKDRKTGDLSVPQVLSQLKLNLMLVDFNGLVHHVWNENKDGMFYLFVKCIPKPDKGMLFLGDNYMVTSALTVVSQKYNSPKELLDFHAENYLHSYNFERDILYFTYKQLLQEMPQDYEVLESFVIDTEKKD